MTYKCTVGQYEFVIKMTKAAMASALHCKDWGKWKYLLAYSMHAHLWAIPLAVKDRHAWMDK